ncbi:MAG: efflux RND transporter periplasmic adaptor subunit [Anaerolineaceae bacterium]|nr:efflux RND transporter periplasmic adaptor subunit [Anaerolineaceae bacterium]
MKRIGLIVIILTGLALAVWSYRQYPAVFAPLEAEVDQLLVELGLREAETSADVQASGYIEAEDVTIAAEVGDRIARISVDEGDYVQAGQVLVELDTAVLDATTRQAEAKVATAKAQLAKVKAGVRAEAIAQAEAAVTVAEADANAAQTRWQDAITLRDNPQELNRQIDAAQTAVKVAELRVQQAIPLKDATEANYALGQQNWERAQEGVDVSGRIPNGDSYHKHIDFPEGVKQDTGVAWNQAGADRWQAWVDLNSAQANYDAAQTALNDLLAIRDNPQEAQLQVAQAQAAYQAAQAQVEVAKSQVAVLQAGAAEEQIALAQAQVEQTEANLAALEVERDQHTLTAPRDGWVVARPANEGEMATTGAPLLQLADLSSLTLTVYVPEPAVGNLHYGQTVKVRVDTFPGQHFTGRVTFISDQPEFTPKNIQTQDERASTVYAVKISLDNPDQQLKPGMPADAVLVEGTGI